MTLCVCMKKPESGSEAAFRDRCVLGMSLVSWWNTCIKCFVTWLQSLLVLVNPALHHRKQLHLFL